MVSIPQLNAALGDPSIVFEHLCQQLCGPLAEEITGSRLTGIPRIYGTNFDGGAEAVARTVDGHMVAVQAKFIGKLSQEFAKVRASLETLLQTEDHRDVTHFVWCSALERTISGRGRSIDAMTSQLQDQALKAGRRIEVHFFAFSELRAVMERHRPALHGLYFGSTVVSGRDVQRLTDGIVRGSLDRVADPGDFGMHFESELERILPIFSCANADGQLDVRRLKHLLHELRYRYAKIGKKFRKSVWSQDDSTTLSKLLTAMESEQIAAIAELPIFNEAVELLSATSTHVLDVLGEHDRRGELRRKATDDETHHGLRSLSSFGFSVLAVSRELELMRTLSVAAAQRCLVISGSWGTGKTYHLARHARQLSASGVPTLFLRARNFDRVDAPIMSQTWRESLPGRDLGEAEFLTLLDLLGLSSGGSATIAIDGLNEWKGERRFYERLLDLSVLLSGYPHITLIVTLRSGAGGCDRALPEYRHNGPERMTLVEGLSQVLNAPTIAHWGGALANPLTARIAAKVLSREHQPGHDAPRGLPLLFPISLTELIIRWVSLLSHEFVERWPDQSRSFVTELVDMLSRAGGELARRDVATQLGASRGETDSAVDFLIDAGLLEEADDQLNRIRFRWQRVFEVAETQQHIRSGATVVTARLAEVGSARTEYLDLLADQCPLVAGAELPLWLAGHEAHDDIMAAFARSLQNRAGRDYTSTTLDLAKSGLRTPDVGPLVCFAALTNVSAGPEAVSPAWLASELISMTAAQRCVVWPRAVTQCLRADGDIEALSALYTWLAGPGRLALPEPAVVGLGRMLLWWSWAQAPGHQRVRNYAVGWLCEQLHATPKLIDVLLQDCFSTGDEHLIEFTTAATLGAATRWPDDTTTNYVCQRMCTALDTLRPQLFRTLECAYRLRMTTSVIGASPSAIAPLSFQEFLRDREIPTTRRPTNAIRTRPRAVPLVLDAADIARFADGKSTWRQAADERAFARSVGVSYRRLREIARNHDSDNAESHGGDERCADLVHQKWLAHQCARYPVGGQIYHSHSGYVKAGSPHNPTRSFVQPGDLYSLHALDPTVPMALQTTADDDVNSPTQWWVVPKFTDTFDDIVVIDPEGTQWVVIRGGFRWLEPQRHEPSREELNWLARKSLSRTEIREDGLPLPGQLGHHYVRVETQINSPAEHEPADPASRWTYLGDQLRRQLRFAPHSNSYTWAAAIDDDETHTVTPDPRLAHLLRASWTGANLDFSCDGSLVLTDPSLSAGGPRALLVRRRHLTDALNQTSSSATITVTTSGILQYHSALSMQDAQTATFVVPAPMR